MEATWVEGQKATAQKVLGLEIPSLKRMESQLAPGSRSPHPSVLSISSKEQMGLETWKTEALLQGGGRSLLPLPRLGPCPLRISAHSGSFTAVKTDCDHSGRKRS